MKIYVDFDGVILDTETLLFDENYYRAKLNPNFDKMKYVQEINWQNMLNKAEIINNSIEILKEMEKQITILTKINSLDNEGIAKIKYLRKYKINCDIILVPFNLRKIDVVSAKNNVLIDDTVHNLDNWHNSGGRSLFFNKDNLDIDNWGNTNFNYTKIKSLDYLKSLY